MGLFAICIKALGRLHADGISSYGFEEFEF